MIDDRFGLSAIRDSAEPERLCRELAAELSDRLRRAEDRAHEEARIIADLRAVGHDLYSFDDRGRGGVWCADWTRPSSGPTLVVTISYVRRGPPDAKTGVDVELG